MEKNDNNAEDIERANSNQRECQLGRRKQFLETSGEVTARVNFIKFVLLISLNIVSSVPSREGGEEGRGFAKLALRPKRAIASAHVINRR